MAPCFNSGTTMTRLFIDIETYSPVDIKHGTYAYSEQAELLMFAYAFDDQPVQQWVPAEGETLVQHPDLRQALSDQDVLLHAHNAMFERVVLTRLMPEIPELKVPYRWHCDMVHAMYKSLPGSLDKLGDIVGVAQDKKKLSEGKRLINLFCKPRTPTKNKPWTRADHTNEPDKWQKFKAYNVQDVEAERAVYTKLEKWPVPESEWRLYRLDQRINDRGLPIDTELLHGALELADRENEKLLNEARVLTGLDNPNSVSQLHEWLSDRGLSLPNLQKHTIEAALADENLGAVEHRVLKIRQQVSKTSTKKYQALINSTSSDGRLRGAFKFYGAQRTGRWAGQLFQPHNLPRGYSDEFDIDLAGDLIRQRDPNELLSALIDEPLEALSKSLRSVVRAPEGYRLDIADLNAIEHRVLGWVAQSDSILLLHEKGLDPYKIFGSQWFRKHYDEITKDERTLSKPPVLGCGYMLSAGQEKTDPATGEIVRLGLLGYAHSMGVSLTVSQAQDAVTMWRDSHPEVCQFWNDVDSAFRQVITYGGQAQVNDITFLYSKPFVQIVLPNNRRLFYLSPKIEQRVPPWERDKKNPKTIPAITYMGVNQITRAWQRLETHPGKITENIVQAIARDVLANGMIEAEAEGFEIIGHVHDEIITCNPVDSKLSVDLLCECMSRRPSWARDLPLGAEGFTTQMYRKD